MCKKKTLQVTIDPGDQCFSHILLRVFMKLTLNLGAIDGLLRVQDTYGLKSLDIARGHFGSMEPKKTNQTWTLPKLTSQNCFEIGYQAYRNGSSRS